MYPHERSLVTRLANKPFALLGVNADGEGRQVIPKIKESNINWRYWIDTPENPIVPRWGVESFPTVLLIDGKGIIRHRYLGAPGEKTLDQAIDAMLAANGS